MQLIVTKQERKKILLSGKGVNKAQAIVAAIVEKAGVVIYVCIEGIAGGAYIRINTNY